MIYFVATSDIEHNGPKVFKTMKEAEAFRKELYNKFVEMADYMQDYETFCDYFHFVIYPTEYQRRQLQ